jgi:hypothetical protein
MNIICLLAVRPCIKTYNFFKNIKLNSDYEVFIVIDDNNYEIPGYDGVVNIIKINNIECENNGYKSCIYGFNNKAASRDKALYYFNRKVTNYNYIWFVEEDVFIPSINTIQNIDKKYNTGDLLVAEDNIIQERSFDWLWFYIYQQIKIDLPYSHSMICAIRCSKKMLSAIDKYAKLYKNLFMDEALFNTLAIHNKLEVLCIPELKGIVWKKDWDLSEISVDNLYHPIKNIDEHYYFREKLCCSNN